MAQTEDADFIQIRVRTKKTLHALLEKAAEERGTSMNAEIIDRLERSFEIDAVIGGPIVENRPLLAIAKLIAAVMFDAGRIAAFASTCSAKGIEDWLDNPFAYDQAAKAANIILEAFRPPNLKNQNGKPLTAMFGAVGADLANGLLEQVARGAARSSDAIGKIASIRDDLGNLLDRIKSHAVGGATTTKEAWGPKKPSKRKSK